MGLHPGARLHRYICRCRCVLRMVILSGDEVGALCELSRVALRIIVALRSPVFHCGREHDYRVAAAASANHPAANAPRDENCVSRLIHSDDIWHGRGQAAIPTDIIALNYVGDTPCEREAMANADWRLQ